jgi:hypothetical protein
MTTTEIDYWLDLLVSHTHDHWYRWAFTPAAGCASPRISDCHICGVATGSIERHRPMHVDIARRMRDDDLYPLNDDMRGRITPEQLAIFLDQVITFNIFNGKTPQAACVPRAYAIVASTPLPRDALSVAYQRVHDESGFADAVKAAAVADRVAEFIEQQVRL